MAITRAPDNLQRCGGRVKVSQHDVSEIAGRIDYDRCASGVLPDWLASGRG